ncbi:nitrilase [Nocardiopsis sp. RSe5-2]|uniref:Nitrilase n=1 Tax=Nocardiopsis endophytica TaxID=3018445 RepID=A0ABT4TX65_9ACTN|nr:nitrilase-related carbon-nitrogen hydrolase [Nocardiopsis endophytica]MDA2809274.1 nitrilase [Nocardiopsis endophytica]
MRPRTQHPSWHRWAWLAGGTGLSFLAMQARFDIALLAWAYPVLLLRFTRTGGGVSSAAGIVLSSAATTAAWLVSAEVFSPPLLLVALPLAPLLALPYIADRYLARRLGTRSPVLATLVFPAAKVGAELAGTLVTPVGTLYGVLGTTQAANLPLVQVASVTGVYGVSFLVAWAAPVAVGLWERGPAARPALRGAVVFGTVLTAVLLLGGARLAFTPPAQETVRVAGISTSKAAWDGLAPTFRELDSLEAILDADPEWMRERFAIANEDLLESTEREARAGAEVVVWAESAAFTLEEDKERLLGDVAEVAEEQGVHVAAAVSVYTEEAPHIDNLQILIGPDGEQVWEYAKSRPVPVLEPYEPGPGVLPTADTPFGRLSGAVCYDGDFPALQRQAGAASVDIMLNSANTWPGIKRLHARASVMRSVENGYSLVRQASRGISNAADPLGRPIAGADYYTTERHTLIAEVPTDGVATVYSRIGDAFAWTCIGGLAVLAAMAVRRSRPDED